MSFVPQRCVVQWSQLITVWQHWIAATSCGLCSWSLCGSTESLLHHVDCAVDHCVAALNRCYIMWIVQLITVWQHWIAATSCGLCSWSLCGSTESLLHHVDCAVDHYVAALNRCYIMWMVQLITMWQHWIAATSCGLCSWSLCGSTESLLHVDGAVDHYVSALNR